MVVPSGLAEAVAAGLTRERMAGHGLHDTGLNPASKRPKREVSAPLALTAAPAAAWAAEERRAAPAGARHALSSEATRAQAVIAGFSIALHRHLLTSLGSSTGADAGVSPVELVCLPLSCPFCEIHHPFALGNEHAWLGLEATGSHAVALIGEFVRGVYVALGLEPEVVVYALVLVERLLRAVGWVCAPLRMSTLRPITLTALVLAHKVCTDVRVRMIDVASRVALASKVACASLELCERSFLKAVTYSVFVHPTTMAAYREALQALLREELGTLEAEDAEVEGEAFDPHAPAPLLARSPRAAADDVYAERARDGQRDLWELSLGAPRAAANGAGKPGQPDAHSVLADAGVSLTPPWHAIRPMPRPWSGGALAAGAADHPRGAPLGAHRAARGTDESDAMAEAASLLADGYGACTTVESEPQLDAGRAPRLDELQAAALAEHAHWMMVATQHANMHAAAFRAATAPAALLSAPPPRQAVSAAKTADAEPRATAASDDGVCDATLTAAAAAAAAALPMPFPLCPYRRPWAWASLPPPATAVDPSSGARGGA